MQIHNTSSQVAYKDNSIVELTLSVVKVEEHDYSIKLENYCPTLSLAPTAAALYVITSATRGWNQQDHFFLLFHSTQRHNVRTVTQYYNITEIESNSTKLTKIHKTRPTHQSLPTPQDILVSCFLGETQLMIVLCRHQVSVQNKYGKEVYHFEVVKPM